MTKKIRKIKRKWTKINLALDNQATNTNKIENIGKTSKVEENVNNLFSCSYNYLDFSICVDYKSTKNNLQTWKEMCHDNGFEWKIGKLCPNIKVGTKACQFNFIDEKNNITEWYSGSIYTESYWGKQSSQNQEGENFTNEQVEQNRCKNFEGINYWIKKQ